MKLDLIEDGRALNVNVAALITNRGGKARKETGKIELIAGIQSGPGHKAVTEDLTALGAGQTRRFDCNGPALREGQNKAFGACRFTPAGGGSRFERDVDTVVLLERPKAAAAKFDLAIDGLELKTNDGQTPAQSQLMVPVVRELANWSLTATVRVKNIGKAQSPPTQVKVTHTFGTALAPVLDVGPLGANETATLTTRILLPQPPNNGEFLAHGNVDAVLKSDPRDPNSSNAGRSTLAYVKLAARTEAIVGQEIGVTGGAVVEELKDFAPQLAITTVHKPVNPADPALIEITTVVPYPWKLKIDAIAPPAQTTASDFAEVANQVSGGKRKQRHTFHAKGALRGAYQVTFFFDWVPKTEKKVVNGRSVDVSYKGRNSGRTVTINIQ